MHFPLFVGALVSSGLAMGAAAAGFSPAPQAFQQEVSSRFDGRDALPVGEATLIEGGPGKVVRAFVDGQWLELRTGSWTAVPSLKQAGASEFVLPDASDGVLRLLLPWQEVREVLRRAGAIYVLTSTQITKVESGKTTPATLNWPSQRQINGAALSPAGELFIASRDGLWQEVQSDWRRLSVKDPLGRDWVADEVLCVGFDSKGALWLGTKAGVAQGASGNWKFYESKDGLPWHEFTCFAAGLGREVWFGTQCGVIRFDGQQWHYRQGPRWLPHDDVRGIAVDERSRAWFATKAGSGGSSAGR
jgi:ligand-binding sensor domain-containing protein